jgi:hypothetical protein
VLMDNDNVFVCPARPRTHQCPRRCAAARTSSKTPAARGPDVPRSARSPCTVRPGLLLPPGTQCGVRTGTRYSTGPAPNHNEPVALSAQAPLQSVPTRTNRMVHDITACPTPSSTPPCSSYQPQLQLPPDAICPRTYRLPQAVKRPAVAEHMLACCAAAASCGFARARRHGWYSKAGLGSSCGLQLRHQARLDHVRRRRHESGNKAREQGRGGRSRWPIRCNHAVLDQRVLGLLGGKQ